MNDVVISQAINVVRRSVVISLSLTSSHVIASSHADPAGCWRRCRRRRAGAVRTRRSRGSRSTSSAGHAASEFRNLDASRPSRRPGAGGVAGDEESNGRTQRSYEQSIEETRRNCHARSGLSATSRSGSGPPLVPPYSNSTPEWPQSRLQLRDSRPQSRMRRLHSSYSWPRSRPKSLASWRS